jgi:hypothetical protein
LRASVASKVPAMIYLRTMPSFLLFNMVSEVRIVRPGLYTGVKYSTREWVGSSYQRISA